MHAAVCERLGLQGHEIRKFELPEIMKNGRYDQYSVTPILLELGLDRIVSRIMVTGGGRTMESHRAAVRFAVERKIPLEKVIGSGPKGLILKRDVIAYARGFSNQQVVAAEIDKRLLRQRRTLARHLLDALRESRALRAELDEAQNRAAATALKLGAEIFGAEAIASDLRDQLNAMEQERNQLRLQLEESRLTNDRLIARLSKQSRTGRVTHIRLGNELFRNRTGASA